jgi:uridine kinase
MPESTPPVPAEVIEHVVSLIERHRDRACVSVAVDGIDAAGKTTFADAIGEALRAYSVPVVRASIDGFHRPAAERHRRASDDPGLSYYEDSFDYRALREELLRPFTDRRPVRTAVFDYTCDRPIVAEPVLVGEGTVLVFDGVFLQRPELSGWWDLSVFLRVDLDVALGRAVGRDVALFGDDVERRYRRRYQPGQAIYLELVDPERLADIVIDMNDVAYVV